MNNFKFYVQELRKMFGMYNDYTIDNLVVSNNDTYHQTYLIPQKASEVKKRWDEYMKDILIPNINPETGKPFEVKQVFMNF